MKYRKGEEFGAHFDGEHRAKTGGTSYLTVLLYLNEAFEGGETVFLDSKCVHDEKRVLKVKPKTGLVMVFQHKHMLHCGNAVENDSIKYCVRTDVLYRSRSHR